MNDRKPSIGSLDQNCSNCDMDEDIGIRWKSKNNNLDWKNTQPDVTISNTSLDNYETDDDAKEKMSKIFSSSSKFKKSNNNNMKTKSILSAEFLNNQEHILSKQNKDIVSDIENFILIIKTDMNKDKFKYCKNDMLNYIYDFVLNAYLPCDKIFFYIENLFYNYTFYNKNSNYLEITKKFNKIKPILDEFRYHREQLIDIYSNFNKINDTSMFYSAYKSFLNHLEDFLNEMSFIENEFVVFLNDLKQFIESSNMIIVNFYCGINRNDINQINEWLEEGGSTGDELPEEKVKNTATSTTNNKDNGVVNFQFKSF